MRAYTIEIVGLRVHAQIGATKEEQLLGQSLIINLTLDLTRTLEKDLLSETIDYGTVVNNIRLFAQNQGPIKLVETFAARLLDSLLESFLGIHAAKVTVQKNYVPIQDFTGHVRIVMSASRALNSQ